MSPILIVNGDTHEVIVDALAGDVAGRFTVRVDGSLPTVWLETHGSGAGAGRPLRVGDRVTLTATCSMCGGDGIQAGLGLRCSFCTDGSVPFATATVTKIIRPPAATGDGNYYLVTVTDVEALPDA